MKNKDKQIVAAVEKFRSLSKNHVSELWFSHTKNAGTNANYCLKRLVDRGYLVQNKNYSPYVYHPKGTRIKQNGQKVNQFLDMVDIFLDLKKYDNNLTLDKVEVEPRFKDVEVRPDMFVVFNNSFFFIESMSTKFSDKQIKEKIKRYEDLYLNGQYKELSFQKYENKIMPYIWFIGEAVNAQSEHVTIFESKNVSEFMNRLKKPTKEEYKPQSSPQRSVNNQPKAMYQSRKSNAYKTTEKPQKPLLSNNNGTLTWSGFN